ncbi:helix-turn-helix domain-containing protein [Moritella sp.]|uniref:helix-turn-helix domain-containing protein n=1 Tax=Moritella sp. TaxID=78556 RepID=UPI003457E01A
MICELIAAHKPRLQGEQPKINMSQRQISRITGIARQRVNEAIKQLEKEGLVHLGQGCIYLNDITALAHKLDDLDLSIRDPRTFLIQI